MDVTAYPYKSLFEKIHIRYGYDFTNYSRESLIRRSTLFMQNLKVSSWDVFATRVLEDEYTFEQFIRFISVTVTEMFRDPSFYLSLRKKVIPELSSNSMIRIWVAGCATGEEVYSIAILLREHNLLERSLIYATDINQNSLSVAKEGIYPISAIKAYTANYLKAGGDKAFSDYYTAKYDLTTFDKTLRNNIVFSSHNLAVDDPFNQFHLIVCRNVLIYFNDVLQERVINLFYNSLSTAGCLALGSKESLLFSSHKESFDTVDGREKIYRRRATPNNDGSSVTLNKWKLR